MKRIASRRSPAFLGPLAQACAWSLVALFGPAELAAQGDPILTLTRLEAKPGKWNGRQPLALRVDVLHPGLGSDVASKPLHLAPQQGPWGDAVTMQVKRGGETLTWAWERLAPGDAAVTLWTTGRASLGFFLDPKAGEDVLPGRYELRAIMAIAAGGDWQGKAISEPLELEVLAPEEPGTTLTLSLPVAVLSPVDPWVLSIAAEDQGGRDLRSLKIEVFDPDGKQLDWRFDLALSTARAQPANRGSQLVLLLASSEPSRDAPPKPGDYTIRATLPPSAAKPTARGSLRAKVAPASRGAERMQPACALAWVDALLSRAETSPSKEIAPLAARAAEVLVTLEAEALRSLRSAPQAFEKRLGLSEVLTLQRRYEEAWAWLESAIEGMPELDPAKATPDELAARLRVRALHAEVAASQRHDPTRIADALAKALTTARENADPNPWANSARASSEYGADRWGAIQAVGAPRVTKFGDSPLAWTPKAADAGEEWLEVTFAEARTASAIQIVQNVGPGAIIRVETIDGTGARAPLWQGPDRTSYAPQQIGILVVPVPPQHPAIQALRITLDTALVRGWNEIDAVQLVSSER